LNSTGGASATTNNIGLWGSGTYEVTVTSVNGCDSTIAFEIIVEPLPTFTWTVTGNPMTNAQPASTTAPTVVCATEDVTWTIDVTNLVTVTNVPAADYTY